jgi:hypothetical protein
MSGPNGKGTDDAEDLLLAVRAGSPDVVVTGQGCSFLTLVFFSLGRTGQPRGRAKTMGAWRSAAARGVLRLRTTSQQR